jgi:hypothetical protein
MKMCLIVGLLAMALSAETFSQEEPPIPPRRAKAAKVGFFGGITPGWLFVDVKPINEILVSSRGAALKENGVMMYGGAGAAYIMVIPNFRVGGVGMSGAIRSTSLDAGNLRRDAELRVGFGGVTLEYVLPVVERLDVAVGGMLGWGGIDITLRQNDGSNLRWDEIWNHYGGQTTSVPGASTRKMTGSYFVWVPSVNVEYALLGWLGVRLGASYVGMSGASWQLDDKYDLLGVPSSINGNGFMINAGIFVGTY